MRKLLFLLPLFALAIHAQTAQAPTPASLQIQQFGASIMGGINWTAQVMNAANSLIDAQAGALMPLAYWELAIIGIWRLGMIIIHAGLASFTRWYYPTEAVGEIWWLLTQIVVLSTILNAYNSPSGGFCLHQIPTLFAGAIANIFDQSTVNAFLASIQFTIASLTRPFGWLNLFDALIYISVLIQMGVVQFLCFVLTSYSYFMIALLIVVGPPLIPLLLTKRLATWFWNWFDELWSLAMLRAFIAGLTYLWAGIYMTFFQRAINGHYTIGQFTVLLPMMIMLNGSFFWGMLKLPSFSARLFNGAGAAGQAFVADLKGAIYALASSA